MNDDIERKIKILSAKQDEIISKMNKIIERINAIPKDIDDEKTLLEKKSLYLEEEIEKIKHRENLPDDIF